MRGDGEGDEAFAPMAVFAAGRLAVDFSGEVELLGGLVVGEAESGETCDDGLELVVVGRLGCGERHDCLECDHGFGEVADLVFGFCGQGFESEGFPGGVGVALNEEAFLCDSSVGVCGLVGGGQALPTAAAEGVVEVDAEIGKGAVGDWLDHAGESGFGCSVEESLAHAGVGEAVAGGFPCLGTVEEDEAGLAGVGEVVESPGEDFGVDGRGRFARGGWGEFVAPVEDFAMDGLGAAAGGRSGFALDEDDAEVAPMAGGEIDGEDAHKHKVRAVRMRRK